ncbi:MAG: DUF3795 domain-containing protein [candidate division Zixibacteria bacterium]|nr:DUF3795 domain-containing protein [candidate division Zixibacteria bacterium]MDD5425278.1 DUF3795 domain-containing protein [candidate division Zixibacteria bacterium]
MKDIIARCGYRCNLCLAYRENNRGSEDQVRFSDGLMKYYGYYLPIEKCFCDGCLAKDGDAIQLVDPGCKVRACVIEKDLENCACCDDYPCDMLKAKFIHGDIVMKKLEFPMPPEDYDIFVKPYESQAVLDAIHARVKKRKPGRPRGRKNK